MSYVLCEVLYVLSRDFYGSYFENKDCSGGAASERVTILLLSWGHLAGGAQLSREGGWLAPLLASMKMPLCVLFDIFIKNDVKNPSPKLHFSAVLQKSNNTLRSMTLVLSQMLIG